MGKSFFDMTIEERRAYHRERYRIRKGPKKMPFLEPRKKKAKKKRIPLSRQEYQRRYYQANKGKAKEYQRLYNRQHKKSRCDPGRRSAFIRTREARKICWNAVELRNIHGDKAVRIINKILAGELSFTM